MKVRVFGTWGTSFLEKEGKIKLKRKRQKGKGNRLARSQE